jgi:hypothetical protein
LATPTQDLELVIGTVYLVARCAKGGNMFDDGVEGVGGYYRTCRARWGVLEGVRRRYL